MLARLQKLKPPITVEVDRSGALMRVTPGSAAGRVQAELRASRIEAKLLAPAEATQAAARVTSWYTGGNVRELTREEYRTLARRWGAQIREDAQLSEDQERRLIATLDAATDEAIDGLGPGGPIDREAWRAAKVRARERVLKESAGYLNASQLDEVREALAWSLR